MIRGHTGIGSVGDSHSRSGRQIPSRRITGKIVATMTMLMGLVVFALPAGAMESIVIPVDTVVRGAEGEVFVLAEVSTGSDAGCEATVEAVAENNPSVHVGTDLIVASGDDQVVLPDVEASAGLVVSAEGTLLLSDTVVVMVKLGPADEGRPNSIFSGGVTVTVTCIPEVTTTTGETTTTTGATTSSTRVTEEVTTTTTTPPLPTVLGTSTTTLPSSTTVPPVSGSTLPFTGPDQLAGTAMAGGGLLLLGLALMLAAREPQTTD